MSDSPVVIVGAGLAGLSCALHLKNAGRDFLLLEATKGPGGRLRTDVVDGFVLDHGFQVFQTAYPEARQVLDYKALQLVELEPGAVIRHEGQWVRMSDPIRRPSQALGTLFNSIGNFSDRWKLVRLKSRCLTQDVLANNEEDKSTAEFLRVDCGFSADMIESFFRPWLSGIFLESQLETSAKYFQFVFRNLAAGPISYPKQGIQAIPNQLADLVGEANIRYQQKVERVTSDCVTMEGGEQVAASKVVLAVPEPERLWEASSDSTSLSQSPAEKEWSATACLYYATSDAPSAEKSLMLNAGAGLNGASGPINHAIILSNSVPSIAPEGQTLVNVNLVDEQARLYASDPEQLEAGIQQQVSEWFGADATSWKLLKAYCIPKALPKQSPGFYRGRAGFERHQNVYVCGDSLETSSLHGALRSGRLVAEAVAAD